MTPVNQRHPSECISWVSSTKDARFSFLRSPESEVFEEGALRPGNAPSLCSREFCGLLSQYAVVGLLYGALPGTISPFFTYYLNMEGMATTSATALLAIPWSLKFFIGVVSDNVPIFGYRRRPFMVFGWLLCSSCLCYMAFKPLPRPYFLDLSLRFKKPKDFASSEWKMIDPQAQSAGGIYVILMMFATLGYLIADCCADAVVVEYAQREPEETRGRSQTAIYTMRTISMTFAQILLAFGLSSPPYGGTFDYGLSFSEVMLILAIFAISVVPITWFCIKEHKYKAHSFHKYIHTLWDSVQSRAFYQIIAYNFCSSVCFGITYVAYYPMTSYWIKASSFSISLSAMIGNIVLAITLIFTGKYGLHWNWRFMVATTAISIILMDALCTMMATFDVIRSQWYWLGIPIAENVPAGIAFIISTYVVVELAGEGNEGACYGLLTTVNNLGSPFASTITKSLNAYFAVWSDDIRNDSMEARRDVAITICISYAFKLTSLIFLVWLPSQKRHVQMLKAKGTRNKYIGAFTVAYLLFALIWSVTTNVFSIFESTKCFAITGGCHS